MTRNQIEQYFSRIGLEYSNNLLPTSELLSALHFAHCTHIPYENLDIIRKNIPLKYDNESLYKKIVENNMGGYCFELNGLFGQLLRELGYKVEERASRYLRGEADIPMRRHRVLKVTCNDNSVWCCDVGIGEICPRYPVEMVEGKVQSQFNESYKFIKDDFLGWVLMDLYKNEWRNFYSFTEEPQLNQDFIALSAFCEYHPDSPFIHQEMFSLKTDKGRISLDGHVFKKFENDNVEVIECDESNISWAYEQFGLKY